MWWIIIIGVIYFTLVICLVNYILSGKDNVRRKVMLNERGIHYATLSDNPHHALCPKCKTRGWLISKIKYNRGNPCGKYIWGVDCEKCNELVWFE